MPNSPKRRPTATNPGLLAIVTDEDPLPGGDYQHLRKWCDFGLFAKLSLIVLLMGAVPFLASAKAAPGEPGQGEAGPNELERLIRIVDPPARFADHKPDFHVREIAHTYYWWQRGEHGPELKPNKTTLRVIFDGDRPIGFLHGHFFARYPGADTSNVINDTFHPVHHRIGTEVPDGSPVDRYRDEVHAGREITVTGTGRALQYTVVRGGWPRQPDATFGARSDITLRVDPVLGYVFERRTQWRIDRDYVDNSGRPDSFGAGGWYSGGVTSIWPDEISYAYTGVAGPRKPDAEGPRYTTWSNNSESMFRRNHPEIAARGFVAYLRDRQGWGLLATHEMDRPTRYNKCPIWGGIHMHTPLVEEQRNGYRFGEYRQRMVTLPPEIVEYIIADSRIVQGHGHTILVRVDGEDFEDQPLPVSTTERGFQPEHNTPARHRISTEYARSGTRSLEVEGIPAQRFVAHRFFPRDRAHTRMLPNRTYRMECWVKVVGDDTEAFVIPTPGLGFTPQQLVDGKGTGTARTESVLAGEGWRKVSAQFTGARHGTPLNVHFVVLGEGKGYFDDFRIYRVAEQDNE
ncbi:MAG: hypothetical protein JJU36_01880 [Phycisphaeraceae bacterium]|nr:hypothetical protein [Phycisphaeraceae bacterium]